MAVDPTADIAGAYRPASAALMPHGMRDDPEGWQRARAAGEGQSFGFADFLDMINPLQHLPVVGTLYRALTGDAITGPARIMGDVIYGGPLGLISGIVDAQLQASTGADIGGHVMALLTGEDVPAPETLGNLQIAQGDAAPDPAAAAQAAAAGGAAPATPFWLASAPASAEKDDEEPPAAMDLPAVAVPEVEVYDNLLDAMNANLDRYDALKTSPAGTAVDESF